jgi:hypothetical protein
MAQLGLGGGHHAGRRQTGRHLMREIGAGEHAGSLAGAGLMQHLQRQQAGAGLQPLAGQQQRRQGGGQQAQHLPQRLHRDGQHRQRRARDAARVGREMQVVREGLAGQAAGIFARGLHGGGMGRVPRPERDALAQPRRMKGQRCAPGASAQHRHVTHRRCA